MRGIQKTTKRQMTMMRAMRVGVNKVYTFIMLEFLYLSVTNNSKGH